MCGRFARSRFDHPWLEDLDPDIWPPRWNLSPGATTLVFGHNTSGEPAPAGLFWGFRPPGMAGARVQINARSERVAEAPMFRQAFAGQRCLIPADGFYEWQAGPDGKQPYFICRQDQRPLFMAGIWTRLPEPQGECRHGFAILTTAAGPDIAALHHRQPVLLDDEQLASWLEPDSDRAALLELCQSSPAHQLQYWPVSRSVNHSASEGPALIKAIDR